MQSFCHFFGSVGPSKGGICLLSRYTFSLGYVQVEYGVLDSMIVQVEIVLVKLEGQKRKQNGI